MKLKIATFNLENLFARFDFRAFDDQSRDGRLPPIVSFFKQNSPGDLSRFEEFKSLFQAAALAQNDDKRQLTSLALAKADADIVCLQEVEDITALCRFRDLYVHRITNRRYKNLILHEGNDFRGIDVAAMATNEFPLYSRSHASVTAGELRHDPEFNKYLQKYPNAKAEFTPLKGPIFRRDCLELEFRTDHHCITIFVCHFKSMFGGRNKTMGMRQLEALAVRRLIESKYKDPKSNHWVIVGDLNDYRSYLLVDKNGEGATIKYRKSSGLDPLLDDQFAVNIVSRRPAKDRWTHYYAPSRHKTQLDYILASPKMAGRLTAPPEIIRQGMPYRVLDTSTISRFPRVGWHRPKASDHCPVVAEFDLSDKQEEERT